ncbi:pentatricopeptide repeat-containing protein At4g02750-like [Selaginella moellendorffii]|uniref:pentatricopeptide repeat-containing protein At4g02750-like n=1 Tax=Selaginella moellendorffii TaxID=88036 RepID=UPI000D1C3278|nr:pentatricopeptide repeat-containing protein At4g02750-like [Selaginella moellendorffii]|eukprot:XP_024526164.1 pentatricopeptide repeat-containing protein At4g02750-like [Selaginella moellendorffii]
MLEALSRICCSCRRAQDLCPQLQAAIDCLLQCGNSRDFRRAREIQAWIGASELHRHNRFLANALVQMYGRYGRIEDARAVFQGIARPSISSWNALIQAYNRNGQVARSKECFDRMSARNVVSWTILASGFVQHGHGQEGRLVFHKMPGRSIVSWNLMIGASVQDGDLGEAERLFFTAPDRGVVSCTTMITGYAQVGELASARKMFEEMSEKNVVSWTAMLQAYSGNALVIFAKMVFDKMPGGNLVSFSAMVAAYAQNGHLDEAKRNAVSWTTLIFYCDSIADAEHCFFDRCPKWSLVSTNVMLQAYAQAGDPQRVWSLFSSMPDRDTVAWNLLLQSCGASVEDSTWVFERIPRRDAVSWFEMIQSIVQSGAMESAKIWLERMPRHSAMAWTCLLSGNSQLGRIEEARAMFDSIPCRDLVAWTAMIVGYAQSQRIHDVKKLFDRMPQWDAIACSMLLASYALNGFLAEAMDLFPWMLSDRSSTHAWNTMIESFALAGPVERRKLALDLFHAMLVEGVKPDGSTLASVMLACNHIGLVESARGFFLSIAGDFGLDPGKEHYSCLVDSLSRAGQLRDAQDLMDSMPFLPSRLDWRTLLGACKSQPDLAMGARAAENVVSLEPRSGAPYVILSSVIAVESIAHLETIGYIPE